MDEQDERRFVRIDSDKNDIVTVSVDDGDNEEELIGLMRDYSKGGCAGVFQQEYFDFAVGDSLYLTTDEVGNQEAKIVWQKQMDKRFVKVGFEFSETVNVPVD